MANLSSKQIGMYVWNVGIHDQPTMARAIAIAMAESGGNPNAHNSTPPDNSYGLWQINMIGSMGPARRKQFGISSNDELFDPATNAKAMMAISNRGKKWTDWSTFTNGSYKKYFDQANSDAEALIKQVEAATPNPLSYLFSGIGGALSDVNVNPLGGVQGTIANAMNGLMQAIFKAGMNFAAVAVGIALIIIALVILMRQPIKTAAVKTAQLAPGGVGKVAGTVGKVVS